MIPGVFGSIHILKILRKILPTYQCEHNIMLLLLIVISVKLFVTSEFPRQWKQKTKTPWRQLVTTKRYSNISPNWKFAKNPNIQLVPRMGIKMRMPFNPALKIKHKSNMIKSERIICRYQNETVPLKVCFLLYFFSAFSAWLHIITSERK